MGCENLTGTYSTVTYLLNRLSEKPASEIDRQVQVVFRKGSRIAPAYIEAIECATGWQVRTTEYTAPSWGEEFFSICDGALGTAGEALFLYRAFVESATVGQVQAFDSTAGRVRYNPPVPTGFDRDNRLPLVYIAEPDLSEKSK